jgi:hypothetical protein
MHNSATHEFTMDPNLLVSVIKQQAGSLSKAILEGVMNSIDAGATRVDVELTQESFTIRDNGKGFTSDEEIQNWFGRFGTPHQEGDATYGRFRMGRGQMFAYAITEWRSGIYRMNVDIENKGLNYELEKMSESTRGCHIVGKLYQPLREWSLADTLTELRKFVAYTPRPVYVNGELYGAPPDRLKTWSFEDDDAYYRVKQDDSELQVYNQGVFVEGMSTWRIGMGGIVVSKRPLAVNFARNSVMENSCAVWHRISAKLESVVLSKLSSAKKLDDGERRFLARRLHKLRRERPYDWKQTKVLTDPTGKHLSLADLSSFKRFVFVQEAGPLACAAHGEAGTFVVTESLLTRFEVNDLDEWLDKMRQLGDVLPAEYETIVEDDIAHMGLGNAELVDSLGLTRKEAAAFKTLQWLNEKLAEKLGVVGVTNGPRTLQVGKHKAGSFVAWTDGKTYITANKKYFKLFEDGLDGVLEWLQTLVHEYMHDTDDSESHSHGEVFYRKFHDTVFAGGSLSMATLAHHGLTEYLNQLNMQGLPKPHKLTRQLRG